MLKKVYFGGIVLVILFVNYYQFLVVRTYEWPELLFLGRDVCLVLGGYAYFFRKQIFEAQVWQKIYYFLMAHLGFGFLLQIVPQSYIGDFSFTNGNLLTNIFAFLLVNSFFVPLYYSVYRLGEI